ncbi:MAG: hypothetical protein ABI452_03285 [Candidatus Limnocylindrales bacterium]
MKSHLPPTPINPSGAASNPVPPELSHVAVLDGMPRQYAVVPYENTAYQYFAQKPLGGSTTLSGFLGSGGLLFTIEPAQPNFSFSSYLKGELGDRATDVEVGPFDAALTWADPDESGVRSHNLYWSDGAEEYSLIGVRTAAAIVNLGRTIACGG